MGNKVHSVISDEQNKCGEKLEETATVRYVYATVLMLNVISHICSERHVNTFHISLMSLCDDAIFFFKTYHWRFLYSIVVR